MTSLIVCRHGATDWNLLGRYQGQSDVPLNADGIRQADLLAAELRNEPIEAIYASTLERAWKTAEAVAGYHGLAVQRDPRLKEVDEGDWEGLTLSEIVAAYPEQHALWVEGTLTSRPTNGESIAEMRDRLSGVISDITVAWRHSLVVIVTHKVALNVIRSIVTGEPTESTLRNLPANGSLCRWEIATPVTVTGELGALAS
jgi:2,3-bisphosphoglycerate-dependent phosphoglycerate mutase